jgi:hypothetical protein
MLSTFDCEYRRDGNVWTLYVNGQPMNVRITGAPAGNAVKIEGDGIIKTRPAALWLAEGGPDKNDVRQYNSLRAALRGERRLVERIFYSRGGSEKLAALRFAENPPDTGPSWTGYKIDPFLNPLADGICNTLVYHCEKETPLKADLGVPCRFTVSKDTCYNGGAFKAVARGIIGGRLNFKFTAGENGYVFATENSDEPKYVFYLFVSMIQSYRKRKGLPFLDTDYILNITEKDSPPVTAGNYAVLKGADITGIPGYLDSMFRGLAYRALQNEFAFTVYSENGAVRGLPPECVPVCQKFLSDFERLYSAKNATLFCVRDTGKQHVYFYVKEAGLFYNTEDSSGAFLARNVRSLAGALSLTPESVIRGE